LTVGVVAVTGAAPTPEAIGCYSVSFPPAMEAAIVAIVVSKFRCSCSPLRSSACSSFSWARRRRSCCAVVRLVVQISTIDPSHHSASRPRPSDLRANYHIDNNCCEPAPTTIGILDDVLTAGAHFRAIKDMFSERFPGVPVVGVFYARRVPVPIRAARSL